MKYTDTLKKSSKKSLIDKISKRLLELEFKLNNTIITKELKRVVKKNTSKIVNKWKTDNQKLKNNLKQCGAKIILKFLHQKNTPKKKFFYCVVYRSNKSRFLNQKTN